MAGSNIYFPGKWKSQTFTTDGTFNVPDSVDAVFVELYGGGGSGGSGLGPGISATGSGGQGAKPVTAFVPVTAGGSVSVTIGLGGSAPGAGLPGNDGGDTSFGAIVARGARGGNVNVNINEQVAQNGDRGLSGGREPWHGHGSYGNGGTGFPSTTPGTNGGIGAGGGGCIQSVPGAGGDGICIVWYKEN